MRHEILIEGLRKLPLRLMEFLMVEVGKPCTPFLEIPIPFQHKRNLEFLGFCIIRHQDDRRRSLLSADPAKSVYFSERELTSTEWFDDLDAIGRQCHSVQQYGQRCISTIP